MTLRRFTKLASFAFLGLSLVAGTAEAGHPGFSQVMRAVTGSQGASQLVRKVANVGPAVAPSFIGNNGQNNNAGRQILRTVVNGVIQEAIGGGLNGGIGGGLGGGACNGGGNGGGGNGNGGGINNGGNVNTIPQQTQLVSVIDLEMVDVALVNQGDSQQGPLYRMTLRNNSNTAITSPFAVAIYGSTQPTVGADFVRGDGQVSSLPAAATATVDVQMPAGSANYDYMTAVIGEAAGFRDANEQNNSGLYNRTAIREVPAKINSVGIDQTAGAMVIDGEGFGGETGTITLLVGNQKYTTTVKSWSSNQVMFTVDDFNGAAVATASFVVARADGRSAPPLDVALAN